MTPNSPQPSRGPQQENNRREVGPVQRWGRTFFATFCDLVREPCWRGKWDGAGNRNFNYEVHWTLSV